MVAPFFELYHRMAAVTCLPSFLLSLLNKLGNFRVLGALSRFVQLSVAGSANLGAASGALGVFLAVRSMNLTGLNPFSAFRCWAVNPILGVIFLVFAIPLHLEFEIEKPVDVFQGDVFVSTALWRHHSWILDGHLKDMFQTIMAHSVSTSQLRRLIRRHIVRSAG